MDLINIQKNIKDFFIKNKFELCKEELDQEYSYFSFIKKDFRIQASFDFEDMEYSIGLDRPFFSLDKEIKAKNIEDIDRINREFLAKLKKLMKEDEELLVLTTKDCELFLKTGSYDGMASGVIEYQGSLYYIKSITNTFEKDRSSEDRKNKVWRNFYVFDLKKEELEKIVMDSLDWMRHINLTPLCRDWKSLSIKVMETEEDKNKHFNSKYSSYHELLRPPVMKLTIHYS